MEESGLDFILSLSESEKAEMFEAVAKNYYNSNFGSFGKSQSDLLMFSLYLDKLIDKRRTFDDYTVSKQLGTLQSNVRQLKKKKQLVYPREYNWHTAFLEYCKNAVFDKSERIIINIPDPNVYLELQHALEERGGFVETQLNSKLLKIPPGCFMELLIEIYQKEESGDEKDVEIFKQQFLKELNSHILREKEIEEEITKENLFSTLKGNKLKIALEVLASLLPEGKVFRDLITIVCDNLFSK